MKSNSTEFSVLMSIYYKEKPNYFKVALESVFNQTLKPSEVVLVEDGELTDDLENVVSSFEKKYKDLKVIRFKKNRGLGPALNDGIKECKYDFIARVDTDDSCKNNRFEVQIKYLAEHPDIDIVGSNMNEYDEDMKIIKSKKIVPETSAEIINYLKKRNPMNHPTVIFKKNKILEVNGYEDYPYFEDYYLWAKMVKNGCKFYNIQDELYDFRGGSSMIQRRGGKEYLKCIKKFECGLLKLKLISKTECFMNILFRSFVSICPNFMRNFIYNKILRRK